MNYKQTLIDFLDDNRTLIERGKWKELFNKAKKVKGLVGFLYIFINDELGIEPYDNVLYTVYIAADVHYFGNTKKEQLVFQKTLDPQGKAKATFYSGDMLPSSIRVRFDNLTDCVKFLKNMFGADIYKDLEHISIGSTPYSGEVKYKKVATQYGDALMDEYLYNHIFYRKNRRQVSKKTKAIAAIIRQEIEKYLRQGKLFVGKLYTDYASHIDSTPTTTYREEVTSKYTAMVNIYMRISNKKCVDSYPDVYNETKIMSASQVSSCINPELVKFISDLGMQLCVNECEASGYKYDVSMSPSYGSKYFFYLTVRIVYSD